MTAVAAVAVGLILLLLFGGGLERLGLVGSNAMPIANAQTMLNQGNFSEARALCQEFLEENPGDDQALYTLGYALLLQGESGEAGKKFARITDEALREEGTAAVVHSRAGEDARTHLEGLRESVPTAYPEVLLASLDVAGGAHQSAVDRLETVDLAILNFGWQRAQYLQTLQRAYFKLGRFEDALRVFNELTQLEGTASSPIAGVYAELARRQLDTQRREEISGQIQRVRTLLDSYESPEATDDWTSRPFRLWLTPVQPGKSRVAAESGLADVLPWMLGEALMEDDLVPFEVVDRELIAEILAEQELSGQLSRDPLRLGQVLGARLILSCEFGVLRDEEFLRASIVDAETTRLKPVERHSVERTSDPEAWVKEVARKVRDAVQEAYPIRGKLIRGANGPEINAGRAVGVRDGMRFNVLTGPDAAHILPGTYAVVDGAVGRSSAPLRLEGFDLDSVPGEGWYLEVARPEKNESQTPQ